jgi:hypothetical protein
MNDEPLIRLRPKKSKHGPNENPRKFMGLNRGDLVSSGPSWAGLSVAI